MPLFLHNTLGQKKQEFVPLDPGHVRMYVCGPTVYDRAHIGNARPVVAFDVLYRLLKRLYPRVTYVRNITDVDDKINNAAKERGEPIEAITQRTARWYHEDMAALLALPPDAEPRATQHVAEMIAMIVVLIEKGHAYAADGHVLFDVPSMKDYGRLSHRSVDDMMAGARVEVAPYKKGPFDFVLWKPSTPDLPGWDSPWGRGRPGWHIECSAMSMRYLGETFDIHGGGLDLVFPHHENEIAQSESFTGKTFARYWMHNGLLQRTGEARKLGGRRVGDLQDQEAEKMSKSKGNIVTISELLARHQPETIRFFLLATHYRRPIDFSDDRIEEVSRGLHAFYRFFERYERIAGDSFYNLPALDRAGEFAPAVAGADPNDLAVAKTHRDAFLSAMEDDFNTGGAIGILFDLLRVLNSLADKWEKEKHDSALKGLRVGTAVLREMTGILGVFRSAVPDATKPKDDLTGKLIELLIDLRKQARTQKNFALADEIRKRLVELSVTLEDRPDGTTWKIQ